MIQETGAQCMPWQSAIKHLDNIDIRSKLSRFCFLSYINCPFWLRIFLRFFSGKTRLTRVAMNLASAANQVAA